MILLYQGIDDVAETALKASPYGTAIYGILVFFLCLAIYFLYLAYKRERDDNKKLNANVMEIALKFSAFETALKSKDQAEELRKQLEAIGYDKLIQQGEKILEILQEIRNKS